MKLEIIEKMKNSASIQELNSYLIEYLNDTWIKSYLAENHNWQGDNITKKDTYFLLQINKYKLYCIINLKELGIPMELSDYPKIEAVVNEVRELNKDSSAIHKNLILIENPN